MAYWITSSFVPFDDTLAVPTKQVQLSDPRTNTSQFDRFRQGVELKTLNQLYGSTQPKIWGGSVDHFGRIRHDQDFNTYGQAVDFSQFEGSGLWTDTTKFNVVEYMVSGSSYPTPILFNDGPAKQQEAIIEPLTIPFRLPSTEGGKPARSVKGGIDLTVDYFYSCDPNVNTTYQPFLDEGEHLFGDTRLGSIRIQGYVSPVISTTLPFNDTTEQNIYVKRLNLNSGMTGSFQVMNSNVQDNGETLIPDSRLRSSTAGFSQYGPNIARYGTDSVAFSGWLRGS